MPVTIKATLCKGKDLQPGDLFSTLGDEYWNFFPNQMSIGEKVFIRTNVPANFAPDMDEEVYKIEIVKDNA